MAGRVAIVTGGARGIGAETARMFVDAGANVVVADLLEDEGRALVEEIGDAATFVALDVTDPVGWRAAVGAATSTYGHLDTLVNNAGVSGRRRIQRYPRADFERVVDINLTGPFLGMQACADAIIAAGGGSIVNVSSIQGIRATPHAHAYVASKFGLRGLTKSVALELAPYGVRVNSVHPGHVVTPLVAHYPADAIPVPPLGRPGQPGDLASMILFLASGEASYATGAEFVVDGGAIQGIPHT